ncbi:MAG: N-acetylmuramoyl-L-alanine amidase [Chloroflexota bacterium]|nr:N-acetylmuramoyl-L-alanine amidase [Chloroflexota bacterium]
MRLTRRELLNITAATAASAALVGIAVTLQAIQRALYPPPPQPEIVPRSAWGAREPDHAAENEYGIATDATDPAWYVYPGDLALVYQTVVIHHTAARLANNQTMQDIQNIHMDRNKWADVGYHFAIDRQGIIYAGRDVGVRGASVAGHNTGTLGIALTGNFELEPPQWRQLRALQRLVNWLAYRYSLSHLAGHGEFNPESECPGVHLAQRLDGIADAAGLQRGTGGYVAPRK